MATLAAPIKIDFDRPRIAALGSRMTTDQAWAKVLIEPSPQERVELKPNCSLEL